MSSMFQWMKHKKELTTYVYRWFFWSMPIWVRWRKNPHRSMGKTKWKTAVQGVNLQISISFFLSQVTNSFFGFFQPSKGTFSHILVYWKWVWNVVQWRIRFSFSKRKHMLGGWSVSTNTALTISNSINNGIVNESGHNTRGLVGSIFWCWIGNIIESNWWTVFEWWEQLCCKAKQCCKNSLWISISCVKHEYGFGKVFKYLSWFTNQQKWEIVWWW